jgi:uncharacterized membrane protein YhaH (DUF805 family)
MTLAEFLFSSAGRVGRALFVLGAAALTAVGVGFHLALPDGLWWLGWLVHPLLLFCALCVIVKRLHDRSLSGWWSALVLSGIVQLFRRPEGFAGFAAVIVVVWAAVELALIAGDRGMNRFGPPQGAGS